VAAGKLEKWNDFMKAGFSAVVMVWVAVCAYADLDWGGGVTRFLGADAVPLTSESGLAVLVATSGVGGIDFSTVRIEDRFSMVTTGALIRTGSQTHRIVSMSKDFVRGYLLNTLVGDLGADHLGAIGVTAGQRLSVIVWDRRTFVSGIPTRGSRYLMLPLFIHGESSLSAQAYGALVPDPVSVIHPSLDHHSIELDAISLFPDPFTLRVQPGDPIQLIFSGSDAEGDELGFSASGSP
jgi:hypothetical protein